MTAKDFAEQYALMPLRETKGQNRSPEIDAFNLACGVPLGSPYCASGISFCFRRCQKLNLIRFPYTASSQAMRKEFERRGKFTWLAESLMQWKGAIGGWTNADGVHGHVFFVTERLTDRHGDVVGIRTIEFNTDLAGDREGQGCYKLTRRLGVDGNWYVEDANGRLTGIGRKLWFCDVSDFPGGAWWK